MRVLAVLAQALAVIAGHDDERGVERAALPQRVDDTSDLGIGVGNFAVIGVAVGFREILRWRFVRSVRVVEVDPHERSATTAD